MAGAGTDATLVTAGFAGFVVITGDSDVSAKGSFAVLGIVAGCEAEATVGWPVELLGKASGRSKADEWPEAGVAGVD